MNEKMPIPNTIFPIGEKNTAYAQYFVGQSYLNMLTTKGLPIGNVTFEPGCRNNWHIHHARSGGGQILLYKSFFLEVLKLLAFQGIWMFLCSQFPLFFPLPGKNKGKSYCTLSSSFAASRLASLLACA